MDNTLPRILLRMFNTSQTSLTLDEFLNKSKNDIDIFIRCINKEGLEKSKKKDCED